MPTSHLLYRSYSWGSEWGICTVNIVCKCSICENKRHLDLDTDQPHFYLENVVICALYREEAGFALSSRAERFSPLARQLRKDGALHPAALCCCGACRGWAARPRECRHAGSTGWAEEVEGTAGTGSPCRHLSLRLTVALRSLVCSGDSSLY